MEPFLIEVGEAELKREKAKARELRQTRWWKTKLAQGLCHHCGGKFPVSELTMDHLVPLIRGGHSTRGNVVVACKACNNQKKYLLPIEWDKIRDAP